MGRHKIKRYEYPGFFLITKIYISKLKLSKNYCKYQETPPWVSNFGSGNK